MSLRIIFEDGGETIQLEFEKDNLEVFLARKALKHPKIPLLSNHKGQLPSALGPCSPPHLG